MASTSRSSKKPLIIILIVLGVLAIVTTAIFTISRPRGPVLVSVEPVSRRTVIQTVSAIGKLQPEFMVKVSSEASGEIIYLGVRDGDTVRKGQLLVRIQPDIVQTQVDQFKASVEGARMQIQATKAEVDRAEADLKRITDLYKKDFATREEFDRAKATYDGAASRLMAARADLSRAQGALRQTEASASRTTIYAPMDGVVTYLAVEQGEKVVGTAQMQGTEMMRISNLNVMNAWVDVDENDVALLQLGDTARIKVDAIRDRVFRGVVYEIGNSAKISSQGTQEEVVNFQVKIRLIDGDAHMRPGMSCNVDIETETRQNVVAVPIGAVTVAADAKRQSDVDDPSQAVTDTKATTKDDDTPQPQVWLMRNGTAKAVPVETGISDRGYIEITKGLEAGGSVIVGPYAAVTKLLKPDSPVKVETPEERRKRLDAMRTTE